MKGLKILKHEAREYVDKGPKFNIVNPQSSAEGSFQGKHLIVDGERKIDLTRLDYLALGSDQAIRQIMIDCINDFDISCPASQMIMKSEQNSKLEKTLAKFHGMNESIVFTSGYSTNTNIIQALGLRTSAHHIMWYFRKLGISKSTRNIPTIFFMDSESHYSLLYAAKSSKYLNGSHCEVYAFPSGQYDHLTETLRESKRRHGDEAVRVIVSDTLSSTSGRVFNVSSL